MRYIVDHDLHIHSNLSSCADTMDQTPETILQYAKDNGLKTVCLTNHFWDETVPGASKWYVPQNYPHICSAKPLPQAEGIRFLFGCETDLDSNLTLGISRERMELMDFIIIPTTHFHMKFALTEEEAASVQGRASAWVRRLEGVLNMDLPFHKIGLAHLTCKLICNKNIPHTHIEVLEAIPDSEMYRLFQKAAALGVGIELNMTDMMFSPEEQAAALRPYRIAKACGCKFYLGSDSHDPPDFISAKAIFEKAVDLLALTEDDKFPI